MGTLKQGTAEYWINICNFVNKTRFDECPFCELSQLQAERDHLKAQIETLAESCRACMNELIDGPTTCLKWMLQ